MLVHQPLSAVAAAVLHVFGSHGPLSGHARLVPAQLKAHILARRNHFNAVFLLRSNSPAAR